MRQGAESILFRPAGAGDEPALRAFLEAAALPVDDLSVARQEFLLAVEDGRIVGSVALEVAGADALIRSLAVAPERRGRGLGEALNDRAIARARERGVSTLYLLTTTAREYALRRGFEPIARDQVPAPVAALPQFRGSCPATAACLRRGIGELAATDRSTLRRLPGRGHRDRATVYAILDEALVCHVAFVDGGAPVVVPATPWRVDGWLYVHGAANSRLLRLIAAGEPLCISVALVDGLVFGRSALRHSTNYRSVVLFGKGEAVEGPGEKAAALARLLDKLSPGRSGRVRPPSDAELAATGVARVAIEEGSAKVRTGPPAEAEADRPWDAWAGTVPLALRAGLPQPLAAGEPLPAPVLPPWLGGD